MAIRLLKSNTPFHFHYVNESLFFLLYLHIRTFLTLHLVPIFTHIHTQFGGILTGMYAQVEELLTSREYLCTQNTSQNRDGSSKRLSMGGHLDGFLTWKLPK